MGCCTCLILSVFALYVAFMVGSLTLAFWPPESVDPTKVTAIQNIFSDRELIDVQLYVSPSKGSCVRYANFVSTDSLH